ncbi:hypothetical protein [uncultured Prevotella sp.]|uniref:hypothetical protein n=1 Tax=uncultured Prevotella sp. TaxID=159272 RepID=UPI002627DCB8|nr:hypothetical protein [uncultured Prevotella sp.]
MKRFFTSTIMFFMCCVFMSAATTVLFEGKQTLNWNDGVQIAGTKLADAQVGDVIVVTTENGGFKLVANYPWTDLLLSSEPTGSYTITTETLEAIKSHGIRVQGGEHVNLLKVELTSEAPQPAEKTVVATLLNTPATIDSWAQTVEVAGSLFAGAGVKKGDFLRINYTTEGDAQIKLCANNPEWHNILDCTDLAASKTVFDMELTEQLITEISADKLYIQGKNFTVNSVQIVREVATAISHITTSAKTDNAIYSLDGRKLNAVPQHGLYIMNGKKHAVR